MPELVDYKGLEVVSPDPTGEAGLAINNNFKALADGAETFQAHLANTANPHQVTAAQVGALASLSGVSSPGGDVALIAGGNIAITPNLTAKTITFNVAGDGSFPAAADSYIVAQRGSSDVESAANLRAAYAAAKLRTPGGRPLGPANRAVCFVPPGRYDFGAGDAGGHGLTLDAEYVDLISLSGAPESTLLTSALWGPNKGTLRQTANDVLLKGVSLETTGFFSAAYYPDSKLSHTKIIDCIFTATGVDAHAMRRKIEYSGVYVNCRCAGSGGFSHKASGLFVRCAGGDSSFGAGDELVGGSAGGRFVECMAGAHSFGAYGDAQGTFERCTAGDFSFGRQGAASGTFQHCVAGENSFGSAGEARGTFTNCVGGSESFGGAGGQLSGFLCECALGSLTNGALALGAAKWTGRLTGLMQNCDWRVTGLNATALWVGAGARVYGSTLIGAGAGKSVDASSATTCTIVQCRLNKGIGANVANSVAMPFNVDDPSIV